MDEVMAIVERLEVQVNSLLVRATNLEAVASAAREVFMSVEWCNGVYVGGNASPREWRALADALSKLDKEE